MAAGAVCPLNVQHSSGPVLPSEAEGSLGSLPGSAPHQPGVMPGAQAGDEQELPSEALGHHLRTRQLFSCSVESQECPLSVDS